MSLTTEDRAELSADALEDLEDCERHGFRVEACPRCAASGCRFCADTGFVPTAFAIAEDDEERAYFLDAAE